ncbi:MAG: NUDIX hydrolase [Pseudomonadales bacterium]
MKLDWERVSTQPGPSLPLFDVRLDRMRHPHSGKEMDRLVLGSVDWVNMVALDAQQRCVMVRQYRFGVGYNTLETPGGMVDPGEDSQAAAQRELLEETGYAGGDWQYLGAVEPNPAIHDHLCHHWLATGVEAVAEPSPGQGEAIEVCCLAEMDVTRAVVQGEIRHALALSALSRVYDLWPRPFLQPPIA